MSNNKICSEGINFVSVSRVVLLNVVWNTLVERQAINHAYMLGQEKVVYVYHLITLGTMEKEKYFTKLRKGDCQSWCLIA
jgi:DNA repair and recombination RAD54-like protein